MNGTRIWVQSSRASTTSNDRGSRVRRSVLPREPIALQLYTRLSSLLQSSRRPLLPQTGGEKLVRPVGYTSHLPDLLAS